MLLAVWMHTRFDCAATPTKLNEQKGGGKSGWQTEVSHEYRRNRTTFHQRVYDISYIDPRISYNRLVSYVKGIDTKSNQEGMFLDQTGIGSSYLTFIQYCVVILFLMPIPAASFDCNSES